MKIVFAVHGYPPELVGGTELCTQAAARSLAARGHEVIVVAGTLRPSSRGAAELVSDETPLDSGVRVLRLRRGDLYSDHWHKSRAPAVARAWRELLERERPDVAHVQHWIRLSRDLVLGAARAGVPAVASLHDLWTTCPIAFRVRPDTREACDAPVGPHPCIACAAKVGPRTTFVKSEQAFLLLGERQIDLGRELELARALLVPSLGHRARLERFGALRVNDARVRVLAPRPLPASEELGVHGARSVLPAPREQRRLLLGVLGHLLAHKGQDVVLDALLKTGERVAIELHFAGAEADPRFAAALRERAQGFNVHFHGAYDRAGLGRHALARVHAIVHAARGNESYSLTLDEGHALGLVQLVPDHGALGERADEFGATVYPPGDRDALARVLQAWLHDPDAWQAAQLKMQRAQCRAPAANAWVEALETCYAAAVAASAPRVPSEEWFEARMGQEFIDAWDRSIAGAGVSA